MLAWPLALVVAVAAAGDPAPLPSPIDLSKPFHTRSAWRLVVTRGPDTTDVYGDPAPGFLQICLQNDEGGSCVAAPVSPPPADHDPPGYWGPHDLNTVEPVYPGGANRAPLLLLKTYSLPSGDGGRAAVTQLVKYEPARDAFERIYLHATGTNRNQEARFITDGPLRGDVISVEPTEKAPYSYWVTVNRLTPARTYRQVLRYRSSTRYNDGNQLAVIDSEMATIERRLGLWKPGSPLPLPAGKPCLHPTLKRAELWCD
ncbi:hypothetical protein [Phenylobacterium sp.]|uniref:hypothetical protein n=1 Tax=Phenylobacterium sp. TaxID=1871053 RepID=UPI002C60ACD1|nr:hypothetical protein [Phenylobacterium sp.]HLZ73875.1 hypothetical protein [Phenylobacterium sp.]